METSGKKQKMKDDDQDAAGNHRSPPLVVVLALDVGQKIEDPPDPMRVSLISTEGPWLEASLRTPNGIIHVMDEFSIDERSAPCLAEEFEIDLSALLDEEESWESIFAGNPDCHKMLERISGWSYRAFGEVLSVDPVIVDCGVMQIPDAFHSNDPRVIGSFVAFTVTRLNAIKYN